MRPATPTPTASKKTSRGSCGCIATGSSTRSIKDLPYDEFVIEQIAGDLLPHPTQDQLVATGFLRNSMINEEGGIDPEQFRMEAMFDRMDAIGKGILGPHDSVRQCHTHKYDPLTHTEYYQMFAFLNNCHEAQISGYTPQQQEEWQATEKRDSHDRRSAARGESRLASSGWPLGRRAFATISRSGPSCGPPRIRQGGQKHYVLDDGSILAAGYAPTMHTTEFTARRRSCRRSRRCGWSC